MAGTWSLVCQLTNSTTLDATSTDHLWWSGTNYGSDITIGQYQSSMHLTDDNDVHLCTAYHLNNTQFVSGTTVSVNGNAAVALPVAQANVALQYQYSQVSAVETLNAIFYAYDGTTLSNPMEGATFQAVEAAQSTEWIACNGEGSALDLQPQSSSINHMFYIGTSVTPTSTGDKVGAVMLSLTYI